MKAAIATALLTLLATPAQATEAAWFTGVNQSGAQGVWRADAAVATVPGQLVFSLREAFYVLHDVLDPGDATSALDTAASVAWTPLQGLQVGVGGSILSATYVNNVTAYNLRSLGNPVVRVKYGHAVWGGLAAGIAAHFVLPTFQVASNASALAYQLGAKALASYTFSPLVEAHVNVGFVGDRTAAPFVNGVWPAQRFVLGINDTSHWDYAVGAVARITGLYIDPFLEVSGQLGGAAAAAPFLARVTPGVRLDTAYGAPLEVAMGASLRLAGEPTTAAGYAGLPQWELFMQVSLHALTSRSAEHAWGRRPCTLDAECGAQQLCMREVCAYPLPAPPSPPVPPPPPPPQAPAPPSPEVKPAAPAPARVYGKVHVLKGSKPVPRAVISVPSTNARWVSDANGSFSGTLPEGEYDVLVTAKQYVDYHRRLEVHSGDTVTVDVELKPARKGRR